MSQLCLVPTDGDVVDDNGDVVDDGEVVVVDGDVVDDEGDVVVDDDDDDGVIFLVQCSCTPGWRGVYCDTPCPVGRLSSYFFLLLKY